MLPITMSQYDHGTGPGLISLAWFDQSAGGGMKPEHREEVAGHVACDKAVGATFGAESHQIKNVTGHVRKGPGLLAVIKVIQVRNLARIGLGVALHGNDDQAAGILDGERAE